MTAPWDSDVVAGRYGGHDGLTYRRSPSTFGELVDATTRWTDRTFLVQGDRRITFGQFRTAASVCRQMLHRNGIEPGDRVMVFGYNSPEWVLALWSLWLTGAVPVLANRWWSDEEIHHAVGLVRPRHVFSDTPLTTDVPGSALQDLSAAFDATPSAESAPLPETHEDEAAAVLFTSGSSGLPKAVELSRRSVIVNQHNILGRTNRFPHLLDADSPQAVSLACTPMFHIGGMSSLLTHFLTGGRIVLTEGRFDPKQVMELIERERVQIWGAVPTMAVRVLEHPDFGHHDLSSLRSWPLGGAPVTTDLLDRIREKLPNLRSRGLSNTWGMTEAGGFLTVADGRDLLDRPGTVGRPYPVVELKIAEPDADGTGEVLTRSPTVMRGYLRGGRVDAAADVDADGWLHTGDLGHLTADGYLFIDGRSKDVVIRGGENIACPHVEAALATHPDVIEVAALGVPHHELGEELAAVLVCRTEVPPPTEEEMRRHLDGVVSYFAVPTRWRIRTEPLPTLAGEKIDKKALLQEFLTGT
ncbi:class I adenylate-forming enzyme family protein [Mycobacterium sp. CPCC 205372]|uniref:Class I adenylate-forming enzyme family protein n=1 Tax=Mycobacterium hippophais TaxID=3016340 RepID=A0ABT4PL76_9MYCO|nr:class I adenylate-forming enzyme family protein [Mycobacterium hippophais]MCZ8377311.1 class I adenylate-forming enzyme family protein [Mycobacterium hippophais]